MGQLYNEDWEHVDIEAFREAIIGNGVITGFLVAQSAVPAMTVLVPAGSCTVDGVVYSEPSGQNLNISNGDATYDRKDIVVYDTSAGNPVVVAGTPAAAPIPADIPSGDILLGIVLVEANETTSILDADITNDRVYANIRWAHTAVSVNTTLTDAHYVVTVDATGGARTITLPTAVGMLGKVYAIKKIDSSANVVTVDGNGAETIDGAANVLLSAQWSGTMIQSDGTNWIQITTDMTDNDVRDAVEAATNSNTFNDTDHTKLNGIEDNATADQTGAEIKSAYEGESNTNALTDLMKQIIDNKTRWQVWVTAGVGDLNTAVYNHAGCGTQAAGLSFGGGTPVAETEEYNGSAWSTAGVGDLNTAVYLHSGCGTQAAGLSFGGTGPTAETEEYNGSAWSTAGVGDLNTAVRYHAGCGTQAAGLSFGGDDGSWTAETEEYNGSAWSTAGVGDLNTTNHNQGAGCGTQAAGLSFGGGTPVAETEEYNGSAWSTAGVGDLNTAVRYHAGCGTQSAGLSFGGNDGSATEETEEYI